jgi:hypothetical protein
MWLQLQQLEDALDIADLLNWRKVRVQSLEA